jgi:predicted ABC-type ATPase
MTPPPELWIVAGPNGAGKTTCVQAEPIRSILPTVQFLNPDDVTRQLLVSRGYGGFTDAPADVQLQCFALAATQVEQHLVEAIPRGESVGVETVLSTDKYRKVVEEVRRLGGLFNLIYITVASHPIAVQRVALRVSRGGHDVPARKIADRFYRSHANLTWFATNASHFWVIDNSGSDPTAPPIMRAYGSNGRLDHIDPDAPEVLSAALSPLQRS